MAGEKKRLSINLSFLAPTDSTKQINAHKSPNNFDGPNAVVGLGILAALGDDDHHQDPVLFNGSRLAVSQKSSSSPIPILSKNNFSNGNTTVEEMELCEEYTCVISHVGGNLIKKTEYFEADILGNIFLTGNGAAYGPISDYSVSGGEIATLKIADFLNSCFLCKKMLDGLDIFMYRGEKAFCSAECRCMQMSIDEQKEKCHSGAKKKKASEYSISPCSGTLQFIAGVAAA